MDFSLHPDNRAVSKITATEERLNNLFELFLLMVIPCPISKILQKLIVFTLPHAKLGYYFSIIVQFHGNLTIIRI
jgi:hypothetical protein